MPDSQSLNYNRVKRFNGRAKYHLSDLGYDLTHPEESLDYARSMLTEYADQFETTRDEEGNITFVNDTDRELLAIAVGSLESDSHGSLALLDTRLREMAAQGHVTNKEKHLNEFTLSVAGFAAKSLKKQFPQKPKKESGLSTAKSKNKPEYIAAIEPDYANLQDVIRYLYEAGNISSSHAKVLLVTLGYVRPEAGMTKELMNDVLRIRADLRSRIEACRKQKPTSIGQDGLRIIEAFIRSSIDKPDLQLSLEDATAMTTVGKTMVKLHQLRDVRSSIPAERANKYDGMGTKINFEE